MNTFIPMSCEVILIKSLFKISALLGSALFSLCMLTSCEDERTERRAATLDAQPAPRLDSSRESELLDMRSSSNALGEMGTGLGDRDVVVLDQRAPLPRPTPRDRGELPRLDQSSDLTMEGDRPVLEMGGASQYCEQSVALFCPFYLRCGKIVAEDLATCRSTFLEAGNAVYEPRYIALEEAGLLELSKAGEVWEQCATHLETVACEVQVFDLDGPCAQLWRGLQPIGGTCGVGIESFVCQPESACRLNLNFCGRCEAALPLDAPCAQGGEETRCGSDAICDARTGRCVPRGFVGDLCDSREACRVGLSCREGRCVGPTTSRVGEACGQGLRCPYRSECIAGLCIESSLLGEPCGTERGCASGWCDGARCQAFSPVGAPCARGDRCTSGRCDGGRCAPLLSACFDDP
ncbi:MAG: hypothetical protein VYD19_00195 [Myxococcota bacterium]|nr:hypothetical protein [Myxococcota bacterium]